MKTKYELFRKPFLPKPDALLIFQFRNIPQCSVDFIHFFNRINRNYGSLFNIFFMMCNVIFSPEIKYTT